MTFILGHTQNNGKNNPRYIDGRTMYREMIDTSKCGVCKISDEDDLIVAHHRDGDRSHNEPANLFPLCLGNCHNKREAVKSGNIVVDTTEAQFPLKVIIDE